ncbi:PepSY domain-containing protein [Paraglaciecola sp. 25GB23A]|uniref:PepSY domain-containing protein n=1 Tax=Paraglaciecola sp. 25GB23A TaxID=3156068 RepID=UPI0032AF6200
MKKISVKSMVKLSLISFLLLSNLAVADDKKKTPAPQTKSEAAQQAQQKVNGRVLKVEQNQTTYRVKVLQKSGRVVSVDVDKKSGKVTKEKKD